VAKELIVNDKVDLMLVASTPETTNPVATTCEAEEVPCLSTVAPWQPRFIGQQGNPGDPASWKPFNYAYATAASCSSARTSMSAGARMR
jgi:branched-chain amino acid transport system substrate-binding protein